MLAEIVDHAALLFPDRVAIDSPEGILTYRELSRYSLDLASALAERGLRPKDIVALDMHSGGDWLVGAVAANRLGAAFAGISPILSTEERAALVRLAAPRLVLASPDLVDGLPLRANVSVIEPGSRGGSLGNRADLTASTEAESSGRRSTSAVTTLGAEPASGTEPEPDAPPEVGADAPAVVCFTSGTTGTPKAAVYTEQQLRSIQRIDLGPDAEQIWDGGSAMLASTQFAHVGMATKFPWYLRMGMTLHVLGRWRPDDALRAIADNQMQTVGAIAPQLALMLRSPLMDELDLKSVRLVIAGGAASPPDLVRQVRARFGAGYSIRYSSTESGGVGLATDAASDDPQEWASVGRPRAGVEARIADEADKEVIAGEVGELHLRSGATMYGYLNDPGATERALTADGWLRTGDLARLDDRGRVVLAGRRSDMYIRGGYNVFPSEIESVIRDHPLVRDVVIVPIPDEVMGEVGLALVVPESPSTAPSLEALRAHAAVHLASYKLPERLGLIDEVPLTSAQKIDRRAAKELA